MTMTYSQIVTGRYYKRVLSSGQPKSAFRLYVFESISTKPGGKLEFVKWTSKGKADTTGTWTKTVEVFRAADVCDWLLPLKFSPAHKCEATPTAIGFETDVERAVPAAGTTAPSVAPAGTTVVTPPAATTGHPSTTPGSASPGVVEVATNNMIDTSDLSDEAHSLLVQLRDLLSHCTRA